jgi:hypothetical protein
MVLEIVSLVDVMRIKRDEHQKLIACCRSENPKALWLSYWAGMNALIFLNNIHLVGNDS